MFVVDEIGFLLLKNTPNDSFRFVTNTTGKYWIWKLARPCIKIIQLKNTLVDSLLFSVVELNIYRNIVGSQNTVFTSNSSIGQSSIQLPSNIDTGKGSISAVFVKYVSIGEMLNLKLPQ